MAAPKSYLEALQYYAEQWTTEQIEEAIQDELKALRDPCLSSLARDNAQKTLDIYQQVLEHKRSVTHVA